MTTTYKEISQSLEERLLETQQQLALAEEQLLDTGITFAHVYYENHVALSKLKTLNHKIGRIQNGQHITTR